MAIYHISLTENPGKGGSLNLIRTRRILGRSSSSIESKRGEKKEKEREEYDALPENQSEM